MQSWLQAAPTIARQAICLKQRSASFQPLVHPDLSGMRSGGNAPDMAGYFPPSTAWTANKSSAEATEVDTVNHPTMTTARTFDGVIDTRQPRSKAGIGKVQPVLTIADRSGPQQ
jgi:hypothetical protein